MNPIDLVLEKLDGVRATSLNQWAARCPCRPDDRSPTLSVSEGNDGRVLFNCHRGGDPCNSQQICESIGLKMVDLYPPKKPMNGTLTTTYDYHDAEGTLVMQVLRYRLEDGRKEFKQRVPDSSDPSGWSYSTKSLSTKPLYRLPAVLRGVNEGKVIYIAEGEKDVDALVAAGYVATCNPQGADNGQGSKWKPNHTASIYNARVVVIADNDEAGTIHANYVATELSRNGCRVKIKRCPLPYKDPADLLGAGKTIAELEEVKTLEPDVFWHISEQVRQFAETNMSTDRKIAETRNLLTEAISTDAPRIGRVVEWHEFVYETASDDYDWLIDGTMERGERVMLVAPEGAGKSVLLRQIAILAGAGVHPFTFQEIPPIRTLVVDLENLERIIRRNSRRFMESLRINYNITSTKAALFTKPDGLDILSDAGKAALEEVISRVEPDLICLGPIYKAFVDPGNKTSTALITEVAMYFDYLRSVYGCALWLEHHAPMGDSTGSRILRPADSAVWLRWPEFGFALSPDPTVPKEYDLKQWRGPRDLRSWPTRLRRSSGMFPFEAVSYGSD